MTDKLHQSLSSIMDGAGDDLELPRLLNALQAASPESQALSDKWRRYHLAQGIMRGELLGTQNAKIAQMDISSAVMQQLEDEQQTHFTDAGAASELSFSAQSNEQNKIKITAEAATTEKRSESAQWLRGGALAASVALLVITGTQIYNLSQEGEVSAHSFVAQEAPPIVSPLIQASRVASDCQPQLFSSASVINSPISMTHRKPCNSDIQAYSPLVNAPYSGQQAITPVSSH